MHIGRNSPLYWLKKGFLNFISIFFKVISLINLIRKSINQKRFKSALIISIDNLSFGGTGKTTLVNDIARFLDKNKIKFAIVTRGYKSKYETTGGFVSLRNSYKEVGDEALLFKHHFPNRDVLVGKDRIKSIKEAISRNNRIILLDDGFQSSNIYKDIKIMLYNPNHPYFYLRNFKFLLSKEDYLFYYQGAGCFHFDKSGSPLCGGYEFKLEKFVDLKGRIIEMNRKSMVGFSALGDNQRFKKDLSRFNLKDFKCYNDHYAFTDRDIQELNQCRLKNQADYLVCTEKDFIKVKELNLKEVPLIYTENSIKFSFDLFERIFKHAEEQDKNKTSN